MSSILRVAHFAPIERSALADLMVELGPDAPTLCEGWTTRDLAAHLVVRLSRIDAAPGIMIAPLAGYLRAVQDKVAAQDWSSLVNKVRTVPGWLKPFDEAINRVEYFTHHEDVRRAQPDWRPRDLPPEMIAALWSRTRTQAKLMLRRTPATVTITARGFGSVEVGRGGPRVDLLGAPPELLLFLMGRQDRAVVELDGPEELTNRLRTAKFGV